MEWWGWVLLGFFLLAIEILASGGFYIFFFGIGALLLGALIGLGVQLFVWIQLLLFTLFSLLTLFMLRKRLVRVAISPLNVLDRDDMVGQVAVAIEDFSARGEGRVEMRGTTWSARNIGAAPLRRGERCNVLEVRGLTLEVRKED